MRNEVERRVFHLSTKAVLGPLVFCLFLLIGILARFNGGLDEFLIGGPDVHDISVHFVLEDVVSFDGGRELLGLGAADLRHQDGQVCHIEIILLTNDADKTDFVMQIKGRLFARMDEKRGGVVELLESEVHSPDGTALPVARGSRRHRASGEI